MTTITLDDAQASLLAGIVQDHVTTIVSEAMFADYCTEDDPENADHANCEDPALCRKVVDQCSFLTALVVQLRPHS